MGTVMLSGHIGRANEIFGRHTTGITSSWIVFVKGIMWRKEAT